MLALAKYVVAGLDQRHGWTTLPVEIQIAGGAAALLGYLLVSVAMAANPFFSTVVRIQSDRGHRVASTGPYRWIRHPGYLGASAFELGSALLLGSAWALLFGVASAATIVMRTVLEDRVLRAELEGYSGFAREVRWRLIPGLW